jgi:hypothetical protein
MLCQLSYTRDPKYLLFAYQLFHLWAEQDSNLRRTESARFTVWCHWPLGHLPVVFPHQTILGELSRYRVFPAWKLAVGVEPTTTGLQNRCSAIELR